MKEWLDTIPNDKRLHLYVGMGLGTLVMFSVWLLLVPIVVGIGKEVYDLKSGKGTTEIADIAWTYAGAFIGTTFILLLQSLV